MAYAQSQLALTKKTLTLTHLVHIRFNLIHKFSHGSGTSYRIASQNVAQLVASQLHVVERRDGFAQLVSHVSKHRFEVAESVAGVIR